MLNFAFQVLRKCLVDKIKQFVTILKFTFEHPTSAHLLLVFSRKQSTFDADVAPLPFQMGERNVFVCDALHSLDYQSIWSNPSTTNFDTNLSTLGKGWKFKGQQFFCFGFELKLSSLLFPLVSFFKCLLWTQFIVLSSSISLFSPEINFHLVNTKKA